MYGNVCSNTWKAYYGLSILNWEKMYGNACGNARGNALKLVTRFIMANPYL